MTVERYLTMSREERTEKTMSGTLKNNQNAVNTSKTAALVADCSPYLDRLLKIYGDISTEDPLLTEQEEPTDIMPRLRILKQKVALYSALHDLSNNWALDNITEYLSGFADFAVEQAFESICQEFIKNKHFPAHTTAEQSGLAVIALGKWGAGELNYSSDIDFMVIFDPESMPISDRYDAQKLAVRFTQRLVDILEKNTANGYVFRTDLRLRPDPGATQIAVSLKACEIYYGSLGQNWERAAMIKARPVTGDPIVSKAFTTLMSQWIWRRSLDFATIQDIVSIKNQMSAVNNRDIPLDADQRSLYDLDLKRGCGGIREIELFVQIQQLIYGGRQPALRLIKTCSVLTALADADHISALVAQELTTAYEFLRKVEHRLQMRNDRQTHSLPKTAEGFDHLAEFCGFDKTADFIIQLQNMRQIVSDAFTSLFAETGSLTADSGARLVFTGNDIDAATMKTLSSLGFKNPRHIAERIRDWHHGHYRATRSTRARQILTHLVPQILRAFGKTQDPDTGFARFDRFLEQQTSGVSLFALFEHNPEILDILALVFGIAPRLGDYLARHPESLDAVLLEDIMQNLPDLGALREDLNLCVALESDLEPRLEIIRRWAREQRFRAGLQILKSVTPVEKTAAFFTDVAETASLQILKDIQSIFEAEHGTIPGGQVCLLALGRFGGRQMTIGSDLDMMMLYDADKTASVSDGHTPLLIGQYYARLMQRINTALSVRMQEGRLYKTDLRLRPHGDAGPMAIRMADFEHYYNHDSWLLENLSLIRARPIGHDPAFNNKVQDRLGAILTRCRNPDDLSAEIDKLIEKTFREFKTDNLWAVKYHRGGLMDIMLKLQYLALLHAADNPELLQKDSRALLTALGDAGIIDAAKVAEVKQALRLFKRIQGVLRLSGLQNIESQNISPMLEDLLLKQFDQLSSPPTTLSEAEDILTELYQAADLKI